MLLVVMAELQVEVAWSYEFSWRCRPVPFSLEETVRVVAMLTVVLHFDLEWSALMVVAVMVEPALLAMRQVLARQLLLQPKTKHVFSNGNLKGCQ
jgi:hypothetical protein